MRKIAFVVLVSVFSSSVFAADGSSGCGAGWFLFKENSLVSSSLRSTTNAILLNATFGMTFGTSNCAKHSIVKADKEQIYFAEANQENLNVEMAQGNGEYVDTFAKVMGCSDSSVGEFGRTVRQHYSEVVPSSNTTPAQMLQNVKKQIRSNLTLALSCAA